MSIPWVSSDGFFSAETGFPETGFPGGEGE